MCVCVCVYVYVCVCVCVCEPPFPSSPSPGCNPTGQSTHLIYTDFYWDDFAGHLLCGSIVLLAERHDVDTLQVGKLDGVIP